MITTVEGMEIESGYCSSLEPYCKYMSQFMNHIIKNNSENIWKEE
jgi:hypothetical protein